jgi:hypothetical protein
MWTAEQHVFNDGPGLGGARLNSPWISTTRDYEVADAYRRGLSGTDTGNGVQSIYLGKVPAQNQREVWTYVNRSSVEGQITFNRSFWANEVSIFQNIPMQALGSPLSHVPVYQPITYGLTIGGSGSKTNHGGNAYER